ncbi:probable serine/threonine-protein kinase fhkB [Anthonomus grandis grandis]|uniref:probable serine/threonine-protein kinase fhkB n=1 Tax=Anthonomus grandis grandis TaxID=2921223 RepID=UPI0021656E8B|nr:probable serine/threonine-protein kinase fhkB [Anthonomus grandis grandis]
MIFSLRFKWLLLSCLMLNYSNSTGIIIKSGIAKNQGQNQKENVHDVKFHKGIANFVGEEGFNVDDERNSVVAQDNGRYGEQTANKKAHLDANNFQNENFHNNGGDHRGNLDSKVSHHKGHHKSGFENHYHKDESGSNSSYFDDGDDQGDTHEQKKYKESFGDAAQNQHGGGKYDSADYENEQARRGLYDNSGKYEKDYGNKRKYNRNDYYDGKEDLDRRNLGNTYEGGSQYAEERYAQRPRPIYHSQPLPYHRRPNHHITIYEDPRYVHSDPRFRRSEDYVDDYVELEVRRDAFRRPYNEDYYF